MREVHCMTSVCYHKLRLPPEPLSLAGKLQSLRSRQFFEPNKREEMKSTYIKFRCTESEKERIDGLAERSGVTLSEYCRQQCLTGRILASPKLSPEEISYFRELKEHNNALSRLANLIRNKDPQLVIAIAEYLEQSQQLYNRFF